MNQKVIDILSAAIIKNCRKIVYGDMTSLNFSFQGSNLSEIYDHQAGFYLKSSNNIYHLED